MTTKSNEKYIVLSAANDFDAMICDSLDRAGGFIYELASDAGENVEEYISDYGVQIYVLGKEMKPEVKVDVVIKFKEAK